MPENTDLRELTVYFTACETLAEKLFADMPAERRARIEAACVAVVDTLEAGDVSLSDLPLIFGSLAGHAVWEEDAPDGVRKTELRDHARNQMIGAFERGCDGIMALDMEIDSVAGGPGDDDGRGDGG